MANAATLSRQGLIQTSRHQISLVRYIQVPRARPRNPPLPWGPRFGTLEWMDRCVLVDPLHGWAEDVFEPIRPWERSSILRGLPRSIVRAALLDHFPAGCPSWLDRSAELRMVDGLLESGRLILLRRRAVAMTAPLFGMGSASSEEVPWDADAPADETPTPRPAAPEPEPEKHWIEIFVVDPEDSPIVGRPWELTLPDGGVRKGRLAADGRIRLDDIVDPGACTLRFPTSDEMEWRPANA